MITDRFGMFFEHTAAAATMTSQPINLMPYAGRDPLFITITAMNPAAATYTVTLEESADNTTYTAVGGNTFEKVDALPMIAVMELPLSTREKYLRMTIAVAGSVAGTVWAGITRDHYAPYDKGLYIDAGTVVA